MTWTSRHRARASRGLDNLLDPAVQRELETTTPVVVVPAFNATGLGVVRDFGRLGVPVIVLDHDPAAIGLASRYAIPATCHDPRYEELAFIEDLLRVGAALPRPAVVFPAFDDHVWALSRHAPALAEHFILPFAGWDVMRRLADKEDQLKAAWDAGIATPATAFVHSAEGLDKAAERVPFPALFKPLRHQEMRRRFGVKVVLAPTRDDLPAAYAKARVCGPLMLQEIVPGDDTDFYTFGAYHDDASRPLGSFISQKVRQHPRSFGESRIAVSRWEGEVAEQSLRLLAELHYHGVSGTEFKRDPRDGRLKLMEVNARHWLHHPLATAAGVNLSHIAYADATGVPFEAPAQRDGVKWLDVENDVPDSLREIARGELDPRAWLTSFGNARVDALYALDDPLPALLTTSRNARSRGRRQVGRVSELLGLRRP